MKSQVSVKPNNSILERGSCRKSLSGNLVHKLTDEHPDLTLLFDA